MPPSLSPPSLSSSARASSFYTQLISTHIISFAFQSLHCNIASHRCRPQPTAGYIINLWLVFLGDHHTLFASFVILICVCGCVQSRSITKCEILVLHYFTVTNCILPLPWIYSYFIISLQVLTNLYFQHDKIKVKNLCQASGNCLSKICMKLC